MKIHTPPMQFADENAQKIWEQSLAKNQEPYGYAVYRYASEWATRMEAAMVDGKKIADVAKQTSHEADTEGITGFMYGCAVSILSQVWKHGEALRLWHNLDTQLGHEGEEANERGTVLNPAVIKIR